MSDQAAVTIIPAFVNPDAGNAKDACAALDAAGGFQVHNVSPAELSAQVERALKGGARRVCVAGGDGTIATAAAAVVSAGAELAILPAGTLNHLARDLALPLDLTEAARVASGDVRARADVGFVNDRLFLNTSSVGAYVTFVRLRERLERRLPYWLASLVAGLRMLIRLRTVRITIEVDGVSRVYRTPLVFIGVGERELRLPTLGKRVEGGKRGLHVMVVRTRSGARTIALALAAAARGVEAVARTPEMDVFLVDRCRIDAPFHSIAVDGEIVAMGAPLAYRIARDALTVIVAGQSA